MGKVSAIIGKVTLRDTANGQRILIEMKNGHQMWVAPSYVNKLLASNFMAGAKPNVLIGAQVQYDKVDHKKGDDVLDAKTGNPVTPALKYKADGYSINNFDVVEMGEKGAKFDELQTKAAIKQSLKGSLSNLFVSPTGVSAKATEIVDELVDAEDGDEDVA